MLTFKNIKQKLNTIRTEKPELTSQSKAIINNLQLTKTELDSLNHNLEYVTDPILLNQIIFQLKATEVRYQYWFCMAKDLNITGNLKIV